MCYTGYCYVAMDCLYQVPQPAVSSLMYAMVATRPDISMLRWIAYIKLLNPEIRHITGKHNVVVDMLSRARYEGDKDPCSDEEDVGLNFFTVSCARVLEVFKVEDYEGEFIEIGKYLSSLTKD